MFQPQPPSNFNPTQTFNPSPSFPQQQQQNMMMPPVKLAEKPVPVEKGPIPAENQVIKTVFDTLINKCMNATTQPITKRKLEDVLKKQEILYDKLRESTVSFTTLKTNIILDLIENKKILNLLKLVL